MAFNMAPSGVPHVGRPRMPFRMPPGVKAPGVQVAAGIAAILCGSLGAIPFVDHFDLTDTSTRVATILSVVAAVFGGVLTLVRIAVGPPMAAGGVALFIASGVALAITRIDVTTALSTTESKLVLAAGAAGLVALVLCVTLFVGRPLSGLSGVIVLLAVVTVICQAVLVHIDDTRTVPQFAAIAASLLVAFVIVLGGTKGRWGSVAALVASGAQVPAWLDLALDHDDRNAAAIAGLIALLGIVGLAGVAVILAATGTADGAFGIGPERAVVSPVVQPMVRPYAVPAGGLETRAGRVIEPVSIVTAAEREREQLGSTVATMAPSPPQWAADPYGRHELRYYDGSRWTDDVTSHGVASVDPIR